MNSESHPVEQGTRIFGIEWAPLMIPFERRMQTFAAFFWFFSVAFGFWFNIAVIYYLSTCVLWPLPVLYLCWMYIDRHTAHNGGRSLGLIRNWKLWDHFRDYFPIRLIKTAPLPPTKNYLFCVYPHGFLATGAVLNFATDVNKFHRLYPGLEPHLLTLSLNFNLPFSRETVLGMGCCSASKKSIQNLLGKEICGKVAVLVVGGAAESAKAEPGTYRIIIKHRKGFVRMALQTGADLVPVVSFGENDMYEQYKGRFVKKFQSIFRRIFGFIPLIPRGRGFFQYSFGILPHRRPINTIVGKAIPIPRIEKPTEEDVDMYHQKFMDELEKTFNENKVLYDAKGAEAELIME